MPRRGDSGAGQPRDQLLAVDEQVSAGELLDLWVFVHEERTASWGTSRA